MWGVLSGPVPGRDVAPGRQAAHRGGGVRAGRQAVREPGGPAVRVRTVPTRRQRLQQRLPLADGESPPPPCLAARGGVCELALPTLTIMMSSSMWTTNYSCQSDLKYSCLGHPGRRRFNVIFSFLLIGTYIL